MSNEEQAQESIFEKLAKQGLSPIPDEHKISVEDFKEAFVNKNKAVKEVKTYNVHVNEGDSYDTYEVEADEFFISQGVMFFKLKEEFVYMVGVRNLITVSIGDE